MATSAPFLSAKGVTLRADLQENQPSKGCAAADAC
jgi:hypothetical protein